MLYYVVLILCTVHCAKSCSEVCCMFYVLDTFWQEFFNVLSAIFIPIKLLICWWFCVKLIMLLIKIQHSADAAMPSTYNTTVLHPSVDGLFIARSLPASRTALTGPGQRLSVQWAVQCVVCSVLCAVQCAMYIVHCIVNNVQFAVCSSCWECLKMQLEVQERERQTQQNKAERQTQHKSNRNTTIMVIWLFPVSVSTFLWHSRPDSLASYGQGLTNYLSYEQTTWTRVRMMILRRRRIVIIWVIDDFIQIDWLLSERTRSEVFINIIYYYTYHSQHHNQHYYHHPMRTAVERGAALKPSII